MIDRRENIFGFTKFSPTNHPATLSPILSGVSQKQVVVQIQFLNMYLSSVTSDAEQRGWSCSVSSVAFLPTRYSADFFICFVFHASHWCPPPPPPYQSICSSVFTWNGKGGIDASNTPQWFPFTKTKHQWAYLWHQRVRLAAPPPPPFPSLLYSPPSPF